MITEKMSIHKALVELKTLDDRIAKCTSTVTPVLVNKRSNKMFFGVSEDEMKTRIKSDYQKVMDLIRRRNAIKKAVVVSNATTLVTVGGVEYTVAEAIEMKSHGMSYYGELYEHMSYVYSTAKREVTNNNGTSLEEKADTYITTLYGTSDMKNLAEDVRKVREEFIASQTYELLDPLDIEKVLGELRDTVDNFLVEVDSALSVSNALTEIEVSY